MTDGIVPQRCVLVLPSTGAFDSRTYRIATTLAGRGHEVTVLARSGPGLPDQELLDGPYRIVRVPVSAIDGLPSMLQRILRRGLPGPVSDPDANAAPSPATSAGPPPAGRPPPAGLIGTGRRAVGAVRRLAAIALTVRSQQRRSRAIAPPADLVHAMAYMGIPIGLALGRDSQAPVVYDARDIYMDAANMARLPGPARQLFGRVERRWARRADRVITVNVPYARVMAGRLHVEEPLVVMNCSYRRAPMAPADRRFNERLSLPLDTPIVLYHGGLVPERGIEQLVAALPLLSSGHLVLMGYGSMEAALRAREADPLLAGRLHVMPAVPPGELLDWVAAADVVAMPIQPSTLNHRLTTPNKLFEAMAAGVPVVASDLPGMAAIVRETGCGVLVDPTDVPAIAAAISSILDAPAAERDAIRERSLAAHLTTYNWESQAAILLEEYGRLTGRPW